MVDFVDEGTYITRIEAANGEPVESYLGRKKVLDDILND